MQEETVGWTWDGRTFACPATRVGVGPSALLLPALSSISTRDEMRPLQAILAARFTTLAVDWPGFGAADKPRMNWTPAAMADFLAALVRREAPALIVAAGHAAGYVVRLFGSEQEVMPRLVLVAPTWRGPLPTMLGRRPDWLATVRKAVDMAGIGPLVYRLNLSDPVIRLMAKGHVYADPAWLTSARLSDKRLVARAKGARFASIRFVTGALDPFDSAAEFHAAATALPRARTLLIWGADTPRNSAAEMAALAATMGTTPTILPRGKLALHEEFASEVAAAILAKLPEAGGGS